MRKKILLGLAATVAGIGFVSPLAIVLNSKHFELNKNVKLNNESNNNDVEVQNKRIYISINEKAIREQASIVTNYEEFKTNSKDIRSLIICSDLNAIDFIDYVTDINLKNKISIQIRLKQGYVFDDNSNEVILSVANIDWKNEDHTTLLKRIKLSFNYELFAQKARLFTSFEELNKTNNLNEWKDVFRFDNDNLTPDTSDFASIADLQSIKFSKVKNNKRRIKVTIQAKEWGYFEYPGSTRKDDRMEFTISNIYWKGEFPPTLKGVAFDIDMFALYNLLVNFYKTNNSNDLASFIIRERDKFFNNEDQLTSSIIKVKTLVEGTNINDALNMPIIKATPNGILILIELNNNYYWSESGDINKYDLEKNTSTYSKIITINEIQKFHSSYIQPISKNSVQKFFLNIPKLEEDVKASKDIDELIDRMRNLWNPANYLIFVEPTDADKIDRCDIVKASPNSLEFRFQLKKEYYFANDLVQKKAKSIRINNLYFGEEQRSSATNILISINRDEIANKAREFESRDEMIYWFKNLDKETRIETIKQLVFISDESLLGVENIEMEKGTNARSIQLIIKLKNGYTFKNISPFVSEKVENISNLLFKSDPENVDEVLTSSVTNFKGNDFLKQARTFKDFEAYKAWLIQDNNWGKYLNIDFTQKPKSTISPIFSFNIYKKEESKYIMSIVLNEGFYFEGQNYTITEKEFLIGNVVFNAPDNEDALKNVKFVFNSDNFYKITKDFSGNTWDKFIEFINQKLINFKNFDQGILVPNQKEQSTYRSIFANARQNNLDIDIEVENGFYVNEENKSEVNENLRYSPSQLKEFYEIGKRKSEQGASAFKWIISLSIVIPLSIIFVIAGWYIIKERKKRKADIFKEL